MGKEKDKSATSLFARISIVPSHVSAQLSYVYGVDVEKDFRISVFLPGEEYLHLVLASSTISNDVKREQNIFQEEDCAINMNLNLQPLFIDIQGLNKFELSC